MSFDNLTFLLLQKIDDRHTHKKQIIKSIHLSLSLESKTVLKFDVNNMMYFIINYNLKTN